VSEPPADDQHVHDALPLLLSHGGRAGGRGGGGTYKQGEPGVQRRSYVRIVAGCLIGFFLLTLVPFMGLAGIGGYYVLLVLVPILVIRWWVRFASIQTDDPDYRSAKRNVLIASAIWVAFFLFSSIRVFVGSTAGNASPP
jgi:hypothetical protein